MTNEQKLDEFIKQIGGDENQKAAYSCLMAAFIGWLDTMDNPTADQKANKNELSALVCSLLRGRAGQQNGVPSRYVCRGIHKRYASNE